MRRWGSAAGWCRAVYVAGFAEGTAAHVVDLVRGGLDAYESFPYAPVRALFLALVVRALFLPGAAEGLNALFTPDFAALADPAVWIAAYGQIFFSLSIAFGIMITYASYLKKKTNLTGSGLVVAFSNSAFEILAGIGVFARSASTAARAAPALPFAASSSSSYRVFFVIFPSAELRRRSRTTISS